MALDTRCCLCHAAEVIRADTIGCALDAFVVGVVEVVFIDTILHDAGWLALSGPGERTSTTEVRLPTAS
jgi:hypothetical protein